MITLGSLTRPPVKVLISRRVMSSLSKGVPAEGVHIDGSLGKAITVAMLKGGRQIKVGKEAA